MILVQQGNQGNLLKNDKNNRNILFSYLYRVAGNLLRPQASLAAAESTSPLVLTDSEWRTLDAIAARIIPTDAEPGAREANCVNFIDKALAHEDAEALPVYRLGLAGVDAVASKRHAASFPSLEAAQQDAILVALGNNLPGNRAGQQFAKVVVLALLAAEHVDVRDDIAGAVRQTSERTLGISAIDVPGWRDFLDTMRSSGVEMSGGPAAFSQRDKQEFANNLDRFLTQNAD